MPNQDVPGKVDLWGAHPCEFCWLAAAVPWAATLAPICCKRGHQIRVLDKAADIGLEGRQAVESVPGRIEDRATVERAIEGCDAVVNLAWSFSDDPAETFQSDVLGHINLLEAARAHGVRSFIHTSSAIVYGRPVTGRAVDEEHPCLVQLARKPLYAVAKFATDELCRLYWAQHRLPTTVLRFWWAFGSEIGGSNLRALIKQAFGGQPVTVPAEAGGSFLSLDDFSQAVELVLEKLERQEAQGEIFNLGTLYVQWQEVAEMIASLASPNPGTRVVPREQWSGSSFLADDWQLSHEKAERLLGYRPLDAEEARQRLQGAIAACADGVRYPTQ